MLGRRHRVATPANEAVQRVANAFAAGLRRGPLDGEALRREIDALARAA
jgi:hypothetical protein